MMNTATPPAVPPQETIVRAKKLLEAADYGDAIRLLSEAVGSHPNHPMLSANLGMAYLRAGERDRALVAFRGAIEKSPNPPDWVVRAVEALEQGALVLQGVRLHVPADVVSVQVLRYLIEGGYEGRERSLMHQNLRPDDRVLELGAGLGFLACVAANKYPSVEYVAIEANPRLIPVIRRNFATNGCNARLVHALASTQEGAANFNMTEDFWASSACEVRQDHQVVEVPAIDANAVIQEILPTMVVIDVEGSELELVPNLDLSCVDRLVIELHPDVYGNEGSTFVMQELFRKGFVIDAKLSGAQVFLFQRQG